MELFISSLENLNGKNNSRKFQYSKKKKIEISSQIRIVDLYDIHLNSKRTLYFQKFQLNSKHFNSSQNIKKFNGLGNPLESLAFKNFLIKKKLNHCYPSKQTFFNLSINKFEQLGSLFFSVSNFQQYKIYYEFELSKKLLFPLIILTNISILKESNSESELLSIIQKNQKKFPIKTLNKKIKRKDWVSQTLYQTFLIENMASEIFDLYDRIEKESFLKKNKIFLNRIIFPSLCFLTGQNNVYLKNIMIKKANLFEFRKIVKKTVIVKSNEAYENLQILDFQKKSLPIRLKINIADKKRLFSKSSGFDNFKLSKNIREIFNQIQITDKLYCSIIVSSGCLPKINQILMNLGLKKLVIKVFQIENIIRLDFQRLIEVLSDLKNENQRLIFMIGRPNDISGFNFVFSVLILPKIQCFKILSGIKKFQGKKTKVFFIKKSSEKCLFLFPIIEFCHLENLRNFSDIKTSWLRINVESQINIPKRIFGIHGVVNTINNIVFDTPGHKVSIFKQLNKILTRENQNKFLCFIFLNLICMISKEKYIANQSLKEKKLKKIIFFLFILSPKVL